ncbi:MAG TPA: formate--tetrahydrofolate ligase [Candidatus Krumholzibacteria bacterium]|nr:formate--tetrahydrofolate ligase [Candidatus Krumholzibacteria bacterium]HPD73111.1 formate--tetrahydrofolate ligase [Candidatus Krumholzibacteria bacterium]HRY41911.1 formate--tetrahydrofolate ligase [Candidatus Krumholzibacteria bacterium]
MATSSIRPIADVAAGLGIPAERLIPYGLDKAKVLPAPDAAPPRGRLVLVSAITPTDAGEGKTTTSIGLVQGLARLGERACAALREPSLGPTFGMKGGATGGGRARLVPSDDINLHFTGDFHAVTSAHNLLAALLDNHIHHGNKLDIDPRRVFWRRVLDVNDRALRHVVIGLGGVLQGVPRETGFDITPASEVMAALCLAESAEDLRERLSRIVLGLTFAKAPVTAGDLKAVGSMLALLRDAIHPNLVQTGEGVPAFLHGGPFANIAHGCSSVLATKTALSLADWVVTEAGFGFDLGAEKFFDIKCRSAGLDTAAVVLVATVRALKRHGGVPKASLASPDPGAVERGLPNLAKHLESIRDFGEVPVIALNRFATDSGEEIDIVRRAAASWGAPFAVCDAFANGGDGAVELADAVLAHAERKSTPFTPLYDLDDSPREKMAKIARYMYGADAVEWTREAERDLEMVERLGYGSLPLCVAKTQMSLSDDPGVVGRPAGFDVTVRGVLLAAGAGYLVPLLGEILRMPGLPSAPQAERIDLVGGKITGIA